MKLVGALSGPAVELDLSALPHCVCVADPNDAILASLVGREPGPQPRAAVACVWPRDPTECRAVAAVLRVYAGELYRVREVVHWDFLGEPTADSVVLAYFVRRRPELSREAFAAHYQERHAPLARVHHPGIARYVQNYVEESYGDAPELDAVAELWFQSEHDARTRFYRDAESRRVIGEDVRRFVDLHGGFAFAARPRTGARPAVASGSIHRA